MSASSRTADSRRNDRAAQPDGRAQRKRRRWIALGVLCLGQLMMVLDATIVNVALPSIQRDLHFTQGNLTWVIDAYLITFGGFLLLAGRMGDLVGRKKVFLAGLVLFTAASIFCGVADEPGDADRRALRAGDRRRRRLGGDPRDHRHRVPRESRAGKAMGMYAFVSAGGGSIGLLAGGALTQSLSWHWIFFVNVPIGLITFVLGSRSDRGEPRASASPAASTSPGRS